jgi:hypothetical protein
MKQATSDIMRHAMEGKDYLTTAEVAVLIGQSRHGATAKLNRLCHHGTIERSRRRSPIGNWLALWRWIPEGYVAPLYESPPGLDVRLLAECLGIHGPFSELATKQVGAYTYLKSYQQESRT